MHMQDTPLAVLEPLLEQPDISGIMIDGSQHVYVERNGHLEDIMPSPFRDDAHLMEVITAVLLIVGRKVDESTPFIDVRLQDDSRVHVVIPPISLRGPVMTIRKTLQNPLTPALLLSYGSASAAMLAFMQACVIGRANIIVSGGIASGKTSLLNLLASFIPAEERIIAMQYAGELQLNAKRLILLETRPPNIEGRGGISMRDLIQNALMMRPERLIISEIREGEAVDMISAMNTGHSGSIFGIHATSPRDALARMEVMVTMGNPSIPVLGVREILASAINLVIQLERMIDGHRRIVAISEVQRIERDLIVLQDIFRFEPQQQRDNQIVGRFVATGHIPTFWGMLIDRGVTASMELFTPDT
jgi:pilus assembly protein CpaF